MSFAKLAKVISSEERCEVLDILSRKERLSFTEIMRELGMEPREEAGSFGYHLNILQDARLIEQDPETKDYCLSSLGTEVSKLILSLKDLSAHRPKAMYVRTSDLNITPFDRRKIEESITREAGAPKRIADEVSREVEDRLKRLRIGYLTAPLIREIVNTVLIERGMEEFRHLMTRLGKPVYDVSLMIRELAESQPLPPEAMSKAAGETVLSEYLLLRVLPREIADAHLSGAIHLCYADRWFLTPQNLVLDFRRFFEHGINTRHLGFSSTFSQPKSLQAALELALRVTMAYEPFVSSSLTMLHFNELLGPYAKGMRNDQLRSILQDFLIRLNDYLALRNRKPKVSLQLSYVINKSLEDERVAGRNNDVVYGDFAEEAKRVAESFADAYAQCFSDGHPILEPLPIMEVDERLISDHLPKWFDLSSKTGVTLFVNTSWQEPKKAVYHSDASRIVDPLLEGGISCGGVLGTVAVNAPRVALQAKGNDSKFVEIVHSTIRTAVRALRLQKEKIVEYLKHSSPSSPLNMEWQGLPLFSPLLGQSNIALVGLFEAAAIQRNLDESHVEHIVDACSDYAQAALVAIEEEQKGDGVNCQLTYASSEPVGFRLSSLDMGRFGYEKQIGEKLSRHMSYQDYAVLPESGNLSVERRVEAENRLQPLFRGGHILNLWIREPAPTWKVLARIASDTICRRQIGFFSFSRDFTLCYSCGFLSGGLRNKCENCEATGNRIQHLSRMLGHYRFLSSLTPSESRQVQARYRYLL